MTHKVNPKIFRIKDSQDCFSRGFYGNDFAGLLAQDFCIREFLNNKLKLAYIDKIDIERFNNYLKIVIYSAKPGLIIGRGGENIEKIKKDLGSKLIKVVNLRKNIDSKISTAVKNIKIEVKEIKNPWSSAIIAGQLIAQDIEKRMAYRRVLKQAISKISSAQEVQGVKIQISGRLNGAEMARTESLGEGRMPRQTIKANIDYAQYKAYCTYGVIGIKIWIYKGLRENK